MHTAVLHKISEENWKRFCAQISSRKFEGFYQANLTVSAVGIGASEAHAAASACVACQGIDG